MSRPSIECFVFKIPRETVQGGLTNEEFEPSLSDYRFLHHYATPLLARAKGLTVTRGDTRFYDAVCTAGTKSEGKRLSAKSGVDIRPSRDTGAGRKVNTGRLAECLAINSHYFFYEASHDDTTLTFEIYWIPIELIRTWFPAGKYQMAYKKFKKGCLGSCEISRIEGTRD